MSSIFISYSIEDPDSTLLKYIKEIRFALTNNGYNVSLDEDFLNLGDNLKVKINKTIKQSQYFILFLSTGALDSEWVDFEFTLGEIYLPKKKIIVCLYGYNITQLVLKNEKNKKYLKYQIIDLNKNLDFKSNVNQILDLLINEG